MKLDDFLHPKCIAVNVETEDKWEVFSIIADMINNSGVLDNQIVDRDLLLNEMIDREKSQSTALGEGLAIPHARIKGFEGMIMALITFKKPISFGALDNKPVSILWAIIVAEDKPTLALQAYSKIYALMQDAAIRKYFETADSVDTIKNYFTKKCITVGGVLTARDIMREPCTHISPDMPLRKVVQEMRIHKTEAVAVEDANKRILGEITCDWLFQFGIPDFFNQLQSVAFINRFDPFEKYFNEESKSTAGDIMQQNYATIPPDATIIEVVFILTVKKHIQVYVVEEGRCIGVIDRTEVLDRILDF